MRTSQQIVFGNKKDLLNRQINILNYKLSFNSINCISINKNDNTVIVIDNTSKLFSNNPLENNRDWIELSKLAISEAIKNDLINILIEIPFSIWLDINKLCNSLQDEIDYFLTHFDNQNFTVFYSLPKEYNTIYQYQKHLRYMQHDKAFNLSFLSSHNSIPILKQRIIDILHETNNYKDRNIIIDKSIFTRMNDPYYIPEKQTLINVAIECELSKEQTNDLLKIAGYYLSPFNEYDQIIIDGIKNKKTADEINVELLKRTTSIKKSEPKYKIFSFHDKLLGVGNDKKCLLLKQAKGYLPEDEQAFYETKWGCKKHTE